MEGLLFEEESEEDLDSLEEGLDSLPVSEPFAGPSDDELEDDESLDDESLDDESLPGLFALA